MAKARDVKIGEKKKAEPLKLEFFADDAIGFCDAETGVCTVPTPAAKSDQPGEQPKSKQGESSRDCSNTTTS